MRFRSRVLTMLASILLILMMIGCDPPAGSTGAVATFEPTLVDDRASEPPSEPTLEPGALSGSVSGTPANSNFGAAPELDDPFAVIGPAFSGLGFQNYSSGCDPFEDTYGTCL